MGFFYFKSSLLDNSVAATTQNPASTSAHKYTGHANFNFFTTAHTPEIINDSYSTRNKKGSLLLINTTPGVTMLALCSERKLLYVTRL